MRLATIKSEGGLDAQGRASLADQIRKYPVDPNAALMLEEMGEMDRDLLLEKLMSAYIGKEGTESLSQIGFDQKTVDEMLQGYVSEQKATRSNNRRKKRR
jgi:ATP-dependent RNA helicase DeaD